MVFRSKLIAGEMVRGGCQLLSNVLCTDISSLYGSVFSVITEVLLPPRWTAVVKFVLRPSYNAFGGPGFDPKPFKCTQFSPNHFEMLSCGISFSYRRHFEEDRRKAGWKV